MIKSYIHNIYYWHFYDKRYLKRFREVEGLASPVNIESKNIIKGYWNDRDS